MKKKQKPQDLLNAAVRWIAGNTAWDFLHRFFSLIVSSIGTRMVILQPEVSNWITKMNISIAIAAISMFTGFFVAVFFPIYFIFKAINKVEVNTENKNKLEISVSPITNHALVVLKITNNSSCSLENCHGKITKIEYREFNMPEQILKSLPTSNHKLEWNSTASDNGFVILRPNGGSEDLSLAWARKPNDIWENLQGDRKYGFSYINNNKPQNLKEGIYYVTLQVEGDLKKKNTTEPVKFSKTFRIWFQTESYMVSLDGFSTRPVVSIHEDNR